MKQRTALQLFGSTVRDYRNQRGLTQEDLAGRTGWKASYIAGIEAGKRNVTLHTLLRLAHALNVKASDLLQAVDEHPELYPPLQ